MSVVNYLINYLTSVVPDSRIFSQEETILVVAKRAIENI